MAGNQLLMANCKLYCMWGGKWNSNEKRPASYVIIT